METTCTLHQHTWIYFSIEFEMNGKFRTNIYHEQVDLNFPIVDLPMSSDAPQLPANGVIVPQLMPIGGSEYHNIQHEATLDLNLFLSFKKDIR